MFVPTDTGPSPAAEELGEAIARLVQEHRQATPELTATDVEQSLRVARRMLRAGDGGPAAGKTAALVAGGLVAMLFAGLLAYRSAGGGGGGGQPYVIIAIVVGLALAAVMVAALRR